MKKIISGLLLAIFASVGYAEDSYKIFVPNPPGSGAGDSVARKLSEIYTRNTGKSIAVINIAGGNQIPAITAFKKEKSAATIVLSSQLVYKTLPDSQLPYSDSDFHLLSNVGEVPNFFFSSTNQGINSTKDLISVLPTTKKPMIGYQSTLTMVNVRSIAKNGKVDITPVGYKGLPEMLINVLNGEILVGHGAIGGNAVLDYVQQGKLKLIGQTSSKPIQINNHTVPSITQTIGIPQFNGVLWLAVSPGTENTPEAKELKIIMQSQEMQDYLKRIYVYPINKDPWEYIKKLREQADQNQELFK